MRSKKGLFFILILAFLLLSACQIDYSTVITGDEEGTFSVSITWTEDDVDELEDPMDDEGYGDNPEDWCDELDDWLDDRGMPRSDVDYSEGRDDFICVISYEFNDFDDLEEIYAVMNAYPDRLRMNRDGEIDYDVRVDFDYFDLEENADHYGADVDVDYNWLLTVPGKFVDHDADEESGRTITWELRAGRENDLSAEAVPASPWLRYIGFAALCLVLLAAIFFLVYFFVIRKKKVELPEDVEA